MKRKIFLTGATGVVGSSIVPLLLVDANNEVHLLLRAKTSQELQRRAQKLKEYWQSDDSFWISDENFRRIQFHQGDVTLTKLGMVPEIYDDVAEGLTHIVHSAANVKLDMSIEEATKQTVFATQNILQLQKLNPSCKLDYVSTVGVKGKSPAPLEEVRIDQHMGFHNTYEAAKFDAEKLLYQAQDKDKMSITIHRPSMVVGHSSTGKIIHFQVFYFLINLICGSLTKGYLPRMGLVKIDTVPNNKVAEVVVESMFRSESVGQIYHHCSGFSKAMELVQLRDLAQKIYPKYHIPIIKVTEVPKVYFRVLSLLSVFLFFNRKWQARLRLFPQFLEYASRNQIFANDKTLKNLEIWKVDWPLPEEYIQYSLEYYCSRKDSSRF